MIILKWTLWKHKVTIWTAVFYRGYKQMLDLREDDNETLASIKGRKFLNN
jgi:hypothetical protein